MTKLTIIIATAVALLATALSPVHAQEQYALGLQTTIVNDDPVLRDQVDPYTWWKPPANIDRLGYGSNGFHFTVAIGNDGDDQLDDLAIWEFDSVDGRYEVQAWIPAEWATAHVQYLIWADENGDSTFANEYVAGPWLDQQTNNGGWQSLGVHTLHGRVRIELRDTRARDDYRDVGTENARIAADAIRLLRNGQTSSEEPPTPPRSVMAVPHGESSLRVTWSAPASSGSSPIGGYELEYSRAALRNHPEYGDRGPYNSGPVSVNGRSHTTGAFLRGVTYTVKVIAINRDGQRSQPAITRATTRTRTTTSPTHPLNLSAAAHATRQIGATWSTPSNSGSARIKHYTVRYSRPAIGDSPPWQSRLYTTTGTSHNSGNLRYGTTYTVTVTAVNRNDRASQPAITRATTKTKTTTPPSPPRDVRVVTGDRRLTVTWDAPRQSGSALVSHYEIKYSREASSGDGGWSSEADVSATAPRSHVSPRLGSGRPYTVEITAVNGDRRRSSTVSVYAAAIGVPQVTLEPEGRSWIIDDPDALILWDEVPNARGYELDWRYMRIDTSRLHDIYNRLQSTTLSDDKRESLSREAAALLEGTEIRSSQFGGDSRPAPNGKSEVFCWNTTRSDTRLCSNLVTGRTDSFNPADPRYRIHSDQHDKVLQIRVRAIGSTSAKGSWSEWAYHPSSRFNAGCTFLDTYNTIKNVQTAIDTASVILTVGGVVAAAFTAGTSIAATQSTRAALIFVAKEMVKLIIKRVAIRRFMLSLIKDLAKSVVKQSALELAGFAFGCLTHGADLQKGDAHALGEQFINEFKDAAIESLDWERALEHWKRVQIK